MNFSITSGTNLPRSHISRTNHLRVPSWGNAYLLLILKLPMKFHRNPQEQDLQDESVQDSSNGHKSSKII